MAKKDDGEGLTAAAQPAEVQPREVLPGEMLEAAPLPAGSLATESSPAEPDDLFETDASSTWHDGILYALMRRVGTPQTALRLMRLLGEAGRMSQFLSKEEQVVCIEIEQYGKEQLALLEACADESDVDPDGL